MSSAGDAHTPSRWELLRFSYAEVLDATKHQDDKVGRLLGAVAFLTGGALVFAHNEVLRVDIDLGGRSYPLAAVTLGAFLLLDLMAVATYLSAIGAPLTLPGDPAKVPSSGPPVSHIYFRLVAEQGRDWPAQWDADHLGDIDNEVIDEIANIADRADRKYSRTTIATHLFLGGLVFLAATVVLGLAAVAHGTPPTVTDPLPWDPPLRWAVALVVAFVVLAMLMPLVFDSIDHKTDEKPLPTTCFVVSYAVLLCTIILADPALSFLRGGAVAIVVADVLCIGSACWMLWSRPQLMLGFALVVHLIAVLGLAAWTIDRPDLQLVVALIGGVLVVVPNIADEMVKRARRARRATGAAPVTP